VQMDYNVLTYDNAIADTANQLLLLNAVRASQHYPKSFTSVGQLAASPPLSADPLSQSICERRCRLQSVLSGKSEPRDFMVAMRAPVRKEITKAFREGSGWTRQLLDLVHFQEFNPTEQIVRTVDAARKSQCLAPTTSDAASRCERMNEQIEVFTSRCNSHFVDLNARIRELRDDQRVYYNTVMDYCHYSRSRIFRRQVLNLVYGRLFRAGIQATDSAKTGSVESDHHISYYSRSYQVLRVTERSAPSFSDKSSEGGMQPCIAAVIFYTRTGHYLRL
jgi:hypothetical protein